MSNCEEWFQDEVARLQLRGHYLKNHPSHIVLYPKRNAEDILDYEMKRTLEFPRMWGDFPIEARLGAVMDDLLVIYREAEEAYIDMPAHDKARAELLLLGR